MSALEKVLADLAAESAELDELVTGKAAGVWDRVTTPEGWSVAHQIGHLHWTDLQSLLAIRDPEAFHAQINEFIERAATIVDDEAARFAEMPEGDLLAAWRTGRDDLAAALRAVPDGEKVPWYGPPMSPVSMATARLMETWAHSLDVYDAFSVEKPQSERVRNVCHIGVRTFAYVHMVRGEEAPPAEVRVELVSPAGELWTWGPDDATERVTGKAWDFALLATRRRHRADVDVSAHGQIADHWLDIVQTFAGDPGNDPKPLGERA